jgi:CRP-like cAMP-binding protein
MERLEAIVAEHPFFHGIDAGHLQQIAAHASSARFAAGEFLFHEGEEANQLYLLRHGTISLETYIPGPGGVTIQTLSAGEVLGWSWLFPPYRWHFSARAIELTRAIVLDSRALRARCEEDHDLGYELMKRFAQTIIQRLQTTRLQLLDMYRVNA